MNKYLFLLSLFLCSMLPVMADKGQPAALNDTIRLDEVIITGTMPKVNLRYLPMSVSVISESEIEERREPSLLPLLTEEVPGLFITQRGVTGYGVANGAAGGISIRGIGGAPTSGVLVLIDGHPQYMGLMGHPLADSYQSAMTERVEVVRGPASMLYGSNAMGGVINIITRQQRQNGLHNTAQVMYGSYNSFSAEASSGWRQNRLHARTNIGYNRSDGHRRNMEFDQWNGHIRLGYDLSRNWSSFVDLNLSSTDASNPGTITAPINDNDAGVTRGMTSMAIENEYAKSSGAFKLFYNFGVHNINEGFAENTQPKPYRFHSNDQMMGLSLYQSYSFFEGNKTTAGFDFHRYGGEAVNRFPDETEDTGLVDMHLNNTAGYLNLQQTILRNRVTVNAGIRLDHHEMNGAEWIPQLGVSYSPAASTVIKAIVSKGFRNPTIREMYMFPPQNPDLKAERLMNYEISLLHSLPEYRLSFGLNLFYIKGDNMIQVAFPEGKPLNINSGEVENKGLEITTTWHATRNLRFSGNYSWLEMTYPIVAAPAHKLHVSGHYSKGRWGVSSGVQYIGNLYTTLTPETLQESFLLWNARLQFRAKEWLTLFLKGENLSGEVYEINAGYPMPGITLFGGIRLNF